ncbi:DUF2336 domain-containing protein [Bradyrhizobium sp.]|jgi:uncharacterized protein (DUF2336 family)|uniref:DUF2336 domain-containing protein n=1 Tax=Bradyrhizobium sp. TaxID=376 RepID=UPI002DF88067|nr:DUF2336 domain-containing protein [Bradyrhizobium sp.]
MAVGPSLIPGLDDIVKNGDPRRRAEAARKISELFLAGAAQFRSQHVDLFDGILTGLVPYTEIAARVALAERLSALGNAPPALVNQLAREDEISVAGPLLRRSPAVVEPTLIEVARRKGQGHLLAMSERPTLPVGVTDVIVRRGDREVVRRVAGNAGAQFSQTGYSALIKRACDDGVLTLTVGRRDDLGAPQLKELLAGSAEIVRRRLFEAAKPGKKAAINQAMVEIIGAPKASEIRRDFAPAQRAILSLHHAGELDEAALLNFAKAHKYEECVAALSALSAARIATIDRLLMGERHDPVLILGRATGLEWATVRALIVLRLGPGRVPSATDIERARLNFERLAASTAQRVLSFWQTRQTA